LPEVFNGVREIEQYVSEALGRNIDLRNNDLFDAMNPMPCTICEDFTSKGIHGVKIYFREDRPSREDLNSLIDIAGNHGNYSEWLNACVERNAFLDSTTSLRVSVDNDRPTGVSAFFQVDNTRVDTCRLVHDSPDIRRCLNMTADRMGLSAGGFEVSHVGISTGTSCATERLYCYHTHSRREDA